MLKQIEHMAPGGAQFAPNNQLSIVLPQKLATIKRIVAYAWPATPFYYSNSLPRVLAGNKAGDKGHPHSWDVSHLNVGDCVLDYDAESDYIKLYNMGVQAGNSTETIDIRIVSETSSGGEYDHTNVSTLPQRIREVWYEPELQNITLPIVALDGARLS